MNVYVTLTFTGLNGWTKMSDMFVELTSVRHDKKIIVNVSRITLVIPSVVGAEIMIDDEDRPLLVKESYERLKDILVPRA